MSKVVVVEPHGTNPTDAVTKIQPFEDMMKKYGVKFQWSGTHATLKGAAAKGSIDVGPSEVRVEVELGMMARMAGIDPSRLEASIRKRLRAAFDGTPLT